MKKIFLLATFIFSISTYGQLNSNYEKGFKAGYCQAKKEDKGQYTPCGTSPIAPIPKTGKESYNDGVIAGYKYYFGEGSSQNALINGAKTLGDSKKFINYGKIIQDNYEKASQSNYSNNKEKGWEYNVRQDWDNGYYIGTTYNGYRYEYGKYYYNNGDRYEGNYYKNERSGFGIYYWNSGSRYEGNWRDNNENGRGTYYYANVMGKFNGKNEIN
jgi:hypothetical protein